jgi:nicotinate phosphoribosyltransferase
MGLPTLSIVCKADAVNGIPCVKLSDNIAKATGDPIAIEKYKKLVGYTSELNVAPEV